MLTPPSNLKQLNTSTRMYSGGAAAMLTPPSNLKQLNTSSSSQVLGTLEGDPARPAAG